MVATSCRLVMSKTGARTVTAWNGSPSTSITYCTASGSSSSPRGEGRIRRQAAKIGGPNRQQFMLSHSGRASEASVTADSASPGSAPAGRTRRSGRRRTVDPLGRDVAPVEHRLLLEQRRRQTVLAAEPAEGFRRVVVVRVDGQEGVRPGKRLGRGHRVGRPPRLGLHGVLDPQPRRPESIVVAAEWRRGPGPRPGTPARSPRPPGPRARRSRTAARWESGP